MLVVPIIIIDLCISIRSASDNKLTKLYLINYTLWSLKSLRTRYIGINNYENS